jgi:hypothetical protein
MRAAPPDPILFGEMNAPEGLVGDQGFGRFVLDRGAHVRSAKATGVKSVGTRVGARRLYAAY